MFKRGRTRNEISPEAVSEESEALRIDLWAGIRIVDDGAYDGFPVGSENELLTADRGALARSIEGKNIVATSQSRGTDRDIGFLLRRVEPIVVNYLGRGLPESSTMNR
jgi:hypothetical protein